MSRTKKAALALAAQGDGSPQFSMAWREQGNRPQTPLHDVSTSLRNAARRARYLARYFIWAARHRSFKHVRWVLAAEGTTWNKDMTSTAELTDEEALLADLKATFPGLFARPLREFGAEGWTHGIWTGGEATMPDGLSIFSGLVCNDSDYYDGDVHKGFLEWLLGRGWYIENYDGMVYFIVPLPAQETH